MYKRKTEANRKPNILTVLSNSYIYIFKHQLLEALLQPAVYLYASFQPIRSLQRDSPWICIWQSQQRIAKTSDFWNFGGEWDGVEQIIDTNYHDGFQIPG